ncbi:hypothetical protein BCR34DRAFT_496876, partial [Clohesyomyces aquaticus]
LQPSFIFRIDEIEESKEENRATLVDMWGHWIPSTDAGTNVRKQGGVSYKWYLCDGQNILPLSNLPRGAIHHETYSMYFSGGAGFWVLKGDATDPGREQSWQPLRFEWDETKFSSSLTEAGEQATLRVQRSDQVWPKMLLPDIYHASGPRTPYSQYGWLGGELGILLALAAFSVKVDYLASVLPTMFQDGEWKIHPYENGRNVGTNQRGLVVFVYTCPDGVTDTAPESSRTDLEEYEHGVWGPYYY